MIFPLVNNTGGSMCERCADGYFGDAIVAKNCTECDCDPVGSMDESCDHSTGVCICRPNVAGSRCELCSPGYYGHNSGTGCIPCVCNIQGAVDGVCDSETGQCNCKPGVTGTLCDQCATGYFDFSQNGCQACNCSSANSVFITCDSTGTCQCQPGSTGASCDTCIENYFQDEQGCTECPQCYQELQQRLDNVTELHDRVESNLFNLLIEASPYDPRLNAQQDEVNNIATLEEMYTQKYNELLIQVTELTTLVSETIQQDITVLEANIQLLKTTSTPVFLQALAAEELMNRTISEFQMAQEEIAKLVEIHIPNITYSLSEINNSHSVASEALDFLIVQVTLLSVQADQISRLVSELVNITNTSIDTVNSIQSNNQETQIQTSILQQNLSEIIQTVHTLTQNVRQVSLDIMQLSVGIREQLDNLPTVQSPESIQELNATLLSSQSTIRYLSNQLDMKHTELSHLQEVVQERKEVVDTSSETLSDFVNKATDLEHQIRNITNITIATVAEVEGKIYLAEIVLENLKNFSDDAFDVATRANEALKSVAELTDEANIVLERATTIQQNVSDLIGLVEDALYMTHSAENVTSKTEQVLSTIDVSMLVENVSQNLNSSQESLHEATQLQEDVQYYQDHLISLTDTVNQNEETVYNSSKLTAESEVLVRDANDSVRALQETLSSLNSLESSQLQQTLQDITAELSSLESELTAADIQTLHSSLLQSLHQQRAVRQDLESDLSELEEEVEELRHLESSLPVGCDSNL